MAESIHGEGMSVGELRKALEGIPDDVPVVGYWETIYVPLSDAGMAKSNTFFFLDVDQ